MVLTVSAVIPARDAAPTVADAVASALAQGHPHLEVVVVDDGSIDHTAAVARRAGATRVVRRPAPGGPAAARNAGVAASRGEAVAFLDADDVWVPDRLAPLLAPLGDPAVAGAVGACRFVNLTADELAHLGWAAGADRTAVVPSLGAAVLRRSALEAVGPLDEALVGHEDYDLFLRLGDAGLAVATVARVVTEVRARPDSLSRTTPADGGAALRRVLGRSARRRRVLPEVDAEPAALRPRWGPSGELGEAIP